MIDDLGSAIGAKVKALRLERGLSGRKLAAAADVSQPFLSQLETGRSSVAIATLYRIAVALDVRPSELLPGPPAEVDVQVLRASERARIPVSEVPHAQTARTAYRAGRPITEVGDYLIEPGPGVPEWFETPDETMIYVIEGSVRVEIRDHPDEILHAGDVLFHAPWLQTRWHLVSESPARLIHVAARG